MSHKSYNNTVISRSHYHVKRNDKGGVLITKEQIQSLFNYIGRNGAATSDHNQNDVETLTLKQVQENMSIFFPNMTSKDFKGYI